MNEQPLKYCASDEWALAVQKWIIPGALEGLDLGDDVLEVGPGTHLPFPDGRFSAALSFTMLHHVPSPSEQDRLLAELARVLSWWRPGRRGQP
jgi:Methyltransferase domain